MSVCVRARASVVEQSQEVMFVSLSGRHCCIVERRFANVYWRIHPEKRQSTFDPLLEDVLRTTGSERGRKHSLCWGFFLLCHCIIILMLIKGN